MPPGPAVASVTLVQRLTDRKGTGDASDEVAVAHRRASPPGGRPVICVSHREPYVLRRMGRREAWVRTTGGLVSALDAVLEELGGRWLCASTDPSAGAGGPQDRRYRVTPVHVSPRELESYYVGYANKVLWPLFHYFPGRMSHQPAAWQDYARVNARFAEKVVHALDDAPRAVAWVHDYHLLLVPRLVREQRPHAPVGLFLHIPFPGFEVFRILPTRAEVLEGMLGASVVGFHTAAYREAFVDAARRILGATVEKDGTVVRDGRRTRTVVAPIGVDVRAHLAWGSEARTLARAQRLRRGLGETKLILGVDRLDYSKGILERLGGLHRLLERHPEHRGRVTLLQIAVPSRERVDEYRVLKQQVDEAVGRLEGRFGDVAWSPVRYVSRSFPPDELAAWYRAADVALVTPLRDGLNLVAKEFVATRGDLGGALVLSEFAGAVEELPDAYVVNPFDPDAIAEALHAALTADRIEQERRMKALRNGVLQSDVHGWARRFLALLGDRDDGGARNGRLGALFRKGRRAERSRGPQG